MLQTQHKARYIGERDHVPCECSVTAEFLEDNSQLEEGLQTSITHTYGPLG